MAKLLDTPHGLKPDGFSGNAHGNPSRSLLKGLPGPKRRLTPSPGERGSKQLWLKRSAPRSK
jgi:hypothetical protein